MPTPLPCHADPHPGTGLGLVITRAIIERTITLAEHTGPGTTFRIQLPLADSPAPADAATVSCPEGL